MQLEFIGTTCPKDWLLAWPVTSRNAVLARECSLELDRDARRRLVVVGGGAGRRGCLGSGGYGRTGGWTDEAGVDPGRCGAVVKGRGGEGREGTRETSKIGQTAECEAARRRSDGRLCWEREG